MKKWLMILCFFLPGLSLAESFTAGQDYVVLIERPAPKANQQPVVTEFFSYGCPWCYKIEAPLLTWQKQKAASIVFNRVPVIFHKEWIYYAKAYYAAKLLGLSEKLDPVLFEAVQKKQPDLNTDEKLVEFFVKQGVDKATAESAFEHSTEMTLQLKEGTALMAQYQIQSVPAVVVNGHYKTDLSMARSPERLLAIVNYLIQKK